ncbi:unnamed protein product [Periconia digitata]|uniref:F-box domain-containing protein n=1 Tax=Periconia digitata TaxID=1303443 RepID=A0A9W4XSI3_9PLEO|nr:unnamed protein product [Periconia digitata]
MPSLADLPVEIVEFILSYLEQSALYALSRTSKGLYNLTTPFLYNHVDLLIPPGGYIPRIDRLLITVLDQPHLGELVKTLRVGISPKEGTVAGQYFLPGDSESRQIVHDKIQSHIQNEPLVSYGEDFHEALIYGEYGAYAALLLLVLPSLKRLDISDHQNETLRLQNLVERVRSGVDDSPLVERIRSIQEFSYNCDTKSGHRHRGKVEAFKVWLMWKMQGVRTLEFSIPCDAGRILLSRVTRIRTPTPRLDPISITKLVIRYSGPVLSHLQELLPTTPHLRSLVCELWHDASMYNDGLRESWLQLDLWNACLTNVRETLETLVLSVEFCDSEQPFFKQPTELHMSSSLDLRAFDKLSTLEVPIPFISGDAGFSIMTPLEPRLPMSLRHLSLRTDMSHAQFPFPFDTSILSATPSHQDAQDEANRLLCARMDVSYTASASLDLVDQISQLKSISIWQPPDTSLEWFERQFEDLATTCKNNGVIAKAVYPMSMRWGSAAHWNLVNEVTLVDPAYPESGRIGRLLRGEREGVPLGLASQYHLDRFERRHVRRPRR